MSKLLEIFTTRELALIVWIVILICVAFILPKWRYHAKAIAKAATHPILLTLDATLVIYISAIVAILWVVGFWDISLLKDTIFWTLFSAVGMFRSIDKVRDARYFGQLIKESVAIPAFFDFLINLYPFCLVVELIVLPLVLFLTFANTYAKYHADNDVNQKKVHGCLTTMSIIVGLIYIGYAIIRTICEYDNVLTADTAKQFILPILLILLFVPYLYVLALYFKFNTMFRANNVLFRDRSKADRRRIKFFVLYYGNFSFKRVYRIWKHLGILAYKEDENYREYIKHVASAPAYKKQPITDKMAIGLFNDIDACCKTLSGLGIGEFSEWEKPDGFEEFYCSNGYYKIKPDWPSNLLLTLQGEEQHIHQLELVLSVYNQAERGLSLHKFQECTNVILQYLLLDTPNGICNYGNFNYRNDRYSIKLATEMNGRLEQFILTIKSEVRP